MRNLIGWGAQGHEKLMPFHSLYSVVLEKILDLKVVVQPSFTEHCAEGKIIIF